MSKINRQVGATSQILQVFVRDSSSTTGAGLTGLVFNTASLTAYYHRDTDTTATAISLVTMTVGTFTSSGFKEIDATNMPGWYQFCPPNAAFASGAASVGFHLKGATNMAPLPIECDLDSQADVRFWNGTAVASPATAGVPDVNVKNFNNVSAASVTTVSANQGTTQPVNFTGTGASALTKSDMVDIAGAAVSTSSAQIGVNLVNWNGTAATSTIPPDAIFIRSGTAQAGGASTITLDAGASATNNLYQNETIWIRSGTGAGQSNIIASYVGATKVATVAAAWATAPDNTSVFSIIAPGPSIASVSGTVNANVTQWLGSAVSAATAGIPDVNTKNINNVAAATPGAAGGILIAGTNAGATSFTAGVTMSNASGDALTLTSSGSNGSGLNTSGNGTGQGIKTTGGATGHGIYALGGASSGSAARFEGQGGNAQGLHAIGFGAGAGMQAVAGATGIGLNIVGGSTSGVGVSVTTTSGDGVSITPTAGSALVATANGTSKHGIVATGGTAGTSDGIKAVAGTGGVPIRGDITGNITGNLSGSAGSVTGNVGGNLAGNVLGNVVGSVGSVAGNVSGSVASVVGNVGGNVVGSVASVVADVGITQAGADKVFGASGAAMAELNAVPSATPSPRNALMLIFMTLRNKLTVTGSLKSVYNDAGTSIASKVLADDGTVYTESEMS